MNEINCSIERITDFCEGCGKFISGRKRKSIVGSDSWITRSKVKVLGYLQSVVQIFE